MALTLKWENVEPFLPTLSAAKRTRVEAWLPVLDVLLNTDYGDSITDTNQALFFSTAADAIKRRLDKPALVDQQSIGPGSVKYNSRAHLAVWFLPEEIAQLDGVVSRGGVRTVRTPAPDGIRFGNRYSEPIDEDGF